MKRKMDWTLALLQLAVIFAAIALVTCLVRLYHHQSQEAFVPFFSYLASVRLAIPPILVLFFSYLMVFIGGNNFGDAPKIVIHYLRDVFFQNRTFMAISAILFIVSSLSILIFTQNHPSPVYSRFVVTLLGSEADRYGLVQAELKAINERNPDLASYFNIAAKVFEARSNRNFRHVLHDSSTPRIFVRSLEANLNDDEWRKHPIRMLALAEAYSMWAQAEKASPLRKSDDDKWEELLSKALDLNKKVVNLRGSNMHPLIQYSALNNSGNALLYVDNLEGAEEYYTEALTLNKSMASFGNLIAVQVLRGKINDAISLSESTRQWAYDNGKAITEGSQFSSILVNGAYAYMFVGNFNKAVEFLREAYAMEDDDLNALNLSLASFLSGDIATGNLVLARFKYPELSLDYQQRRVREEYNPCFYFVKAMSIPASEDLRAAAHFYTYMGIARTGEQLSEMSYESLLELKNDVYGYLTKDPTPCQHLSLIPAVEQKLTSKIP